MDLIFIRDIHNKDYITERLIDLLNEKRYKINDLRVITIEENRDLTFVMEEFDSIVELSENIFEKLKDFRSVCVIMNDVVDEKDSYVVTYLMFVQTEDYDLFEILSIL